MDNDEKVLFNPVEPDSQNQPQDVALPASPQGEPAAQAPVPTQEVQQPGSPSQVSEALQPVQMNEKHSGFSGGGIIKKIIIGVVILIVLISAVVFFLSRGKGEKKQVKLVWWGLWEDVKVVEPLISDFQKANPNITVEYIKQDPKQYKDKLQTRIKNGTGPDIFRFHNTWVPMISSELLPLSSDVITPADFKKNFYPVMQQDLIQNGGIYGIPLGADTLALFVNTDLLNAVGERSPETWDDFSRILPKLTVKDAETKRIKTAGAAMGTFGNITHAPDIISLLFVQQGIDMRKFPSAKKSQKTEVLDFYTFFAKGDQSFWDSTLDESILSFSRGSLAMYIGFSFDIFRIQALNKDLHFSTNPVPQLPNRKVALASYWVEGVSAKSLNQKEALLFMQFLSKKETAQKFYKSASNTRAFGEPYARRDLAQSLKDNQLLFPFVSQLEYASSSVFASDTFDGADGINSSSNEYLGNAINAIINDNSSAETVIESLDSGIGQVYQKYGIQ